MTIALLRNRPGHRQRGLVEQPVRRRPWKGFDDDLERGLVRDVAHALTVIEFGQDSEIMGLAEDVHSARGLHVKVSGGTRFVRSDNEIISPNAPRGALVPA